MPTTSRVLHLLLTGVVNNNSYKYYLLAKNKICTIREVFKNTTYFPYKEILGTLSIPIVNNDCNNTAGF